MGRYAGFFVFLLLLLLIIPAFSLLGGEKAAENRPPKEEDTVTASLAFPTLAGLRLEEPQAYQDNRFYLIEDHLTRETMALTPEEYLTGVVAAEMPASFHTEALKAQAVAAHTYALRQIGETDEPPYLSTDPARFQAYLSPRERQEAWGENYDLYERKLSQAVDEVVDQVMVYDGEPIAAAFHAISSGRTESAENVWGQSLPYLEPVESQGDLLSPGYETQVLLPEAEVANALLEAYPGISLSEDRSQWFSQLRRSESGSVLSLLVGDQETTGQAVRRLFGLRSAHFTVEPGDGGFLFTCLGSGHGVGMSQYGADYLARQGFSWEEILTYYYKNVTFVHTAQ